MAESHAEGEKSPEGEDRREFLYLLTGAVGAVGAGAFAWPLIDQMNPSADVRALSSTEIDVGNLEPGQAITVKWRGQPVFVRRRTQKEIDDAAAVPVADLRDPETDKDRVKKPEWLIVNGSCTHLGCVPGNRVSDKKGEFGGWYCPCHGSHYDTAGRIRKGPAPKNLLVPPYEFLSDTVIKIG